MIIAQSILPSGRVIQLEPLKTKNYRVAQDRAAQKDPSMGSRYLSSLGVELLLEGFRGLTLGALDWTGEETDEQIDEKLKAIPPEAFAKPTYENLVSEGPLNLEELLPSPDDFQAAVNLAVELTIPKRDRKGAALTGKRRMISGQ